MAQSSSKPLVLEYKCRRYDGGTEKELIEQIELQKYLCEERNRVENRQFSPSCLQGMQPVVNPGVQYSEVPVQPAAAEPVFGAVEPTEPNRRERLCKALVAPYTALIWGLLGLFVGSVVTLALRCNPVADEDAIHQERISLMQQSRLVIGKSIRDILLAPWVAIKSGLIKQV